MMALAGTAAAANTDSPAVGRALGLIKTHGAAIRASANDAFVARDVIVDKDGSEHVRFNRTYAGLPVFGGDIVVHSKGGQFKSASLTQGAALNVNTHASLNSADALVAAGTRFGSNFVGTPSASLVIYARDQGAAKLAYQVGFKGADKNGNDVDMTYFVDAKNGKILLGYSNLETGKPGGGTGGGGTPAVGTGRSIYSGNVTLNTAGSGTSYNMTDTTRGGGYTTDMANGTRGNGTLFTDADNTWGNNTNSDRASAAADAHYGIATTWDFYKNTFGRNGIANDGKGALSKVHYSRNYVNAYWSDACFCMTFGDGDGVTYGPLVNLDVAGHEMSHGVTSRTSNLTYSGESGGLNEANSDIMGTMVEYYANNASDPGDYLIGEKIYLSNPGNLKALRYMFKPSRDGASPDCYISTIGSKDVHYSSGVANHFFYLLAEGAVNPAGFSYTPSQLVCNGNTAVGGIGRSKAQQIWFRGMTVYMTSSTNYHGARVATLQAAADLYGAGSAEQNAVAASWDAVSVN
jgi:Zn-dependent metalloprotease